MVAFFVDIFEHIFAFVLEFACLLNAHSQVLFLLLIIFAVAHFGFVLQYIQGVY